MATLKRYGNKFKVTCHRSLMQSGWELDSKKYAEKNSVNDKKLDCNISRARSKIFEYALCNHWDYFVTLTIDKAKFDRYDLKKYKHALGVFLDNYRRDFNCKVTYLLIPEQHKDGAWHMHGFFAGLPREHLIENAYGYLDWLAYQKKFGYISLDYIKDNEACAKYVTKYVSKDMASNNKELGAHLYYCSRGLQTAELMKKDLMQKSMKPDYENDFVKVKWYEHITEALSLFNEESVTQK